MAARRTGHIVYKKDLSPALTIFRVMPEAGTSFPRYVAGQYIVLGRDDVPLTRRVGVDERGRTVFGPDLDDTGRQRVGSVMHVYSIASSPWETETNGFLEFYVVQEVSSGVPGRLSTVLLSLPCSEDEPVSYVDRIVGHFTLDKLVKDARSVVMVGTGTGLAPFVSMIKQLHQEGTDERAYTLLHTNRTYEELGYHQTLLEIEAAARFDFRYVATVSRPTERDRQNRQIGVGRATNVLRLVYDLPMSEEEAVSETAPDSPGRAAAERALTRAPKPALPAAATLEEIRERLTPDRSVILTCGNPGSTADVVQTATRVGIRAEVESW